MEKPEKCEMQLKAAPAVSEFCADTPQEVLVHTTHG
jgi:hypothetical protein